MQTIRRTEIDGVIRDNFSFIIKDWRAGIAFLLIFMASLSVSLIIYSNVSWQNGFFGNSFLMNQITSISIAQPISKLDAFIIFLVSFLISIYAIELLVLTKQRKSMPFIDSFKNYPAFLFSSVILMIVLFFFMFALVIPSIFLFVKMAFYPQELLIKKRNPISALSASYEFTTGKFWSVFGLIMGIMLVAFAFSVIISIIGFYSILASIILNSLLCGFIAVFFIGSMTDYFVSEQKHIR